MWRCVREDEPMLEHTEEYEVSPSTDGATERMPCESKSPSPLEASVGQPAMAESSRLPGGLVPGRDLRSSVTGDVNRHGVGKAQIRLAKRQHEASSNVESSGSTVTGMFESEERKRRLVKVGAQLDEHNRATSKPKFSAPGELDTLVFDKERSEVQDACQTDQMGPTAQVGLPAHVPIFALRPAHMLTPARPLRLRSSSLVRTCFLQP